MLKGGLLRERSMRGVLTRVEYSRIGARPLVKVYSPRRVRRMLREAGFHDVTTTIREFGPHSTFVTQHLSKHLTILRDPRVLDRLGSIGGWYVIGRGLRAPQ
jgi:hypothetical protein